jgi:flavodoxin I
MIGRMPTDGYTFDDSAAVENGDFIGLALDEVNEDNLTDERIDQWVNSLQPQL